MKTSRSFIETMLGFVRKFLVFVNAPERFSFRQRGEYHKKVSEQVFPKKVENMEELYWAVEL